MSSLGKSFCLFALVLGAPDCRPCGDVTASDAERSSIVADATTVVMEPHACEHRTNVTLAMVGASGDAAIPCFKASPLIGVQPGIVDRVAVTGRLTREDGVSRIGRTPIQFKPGFEESCDGEVLIAGTVVYPVAVVDDVAVGPPRLVDVRVLATKPNDEQIRSCVNVPLLSWASVQALSDPDECPASGQSRQWRLMLYIEPSGKVRSVDVLEPDSPGELAACIKRHFLGLSVEQFSGSVPLARPKLLIWPKPKQ